MVITFENEENEKKKKPQIILKKTFIEKIKLINCTNKS